MIDLHLHSTASDGSLAPTEVVRRAKEAGLVSIALTDHDTFGGLAEARRAAERFGIEVIPGVEISLAFARGTLHMIGLFVDTEEPELKTALERVLEGRADRNRRLAERLDELGIPVTVEQAASRAGGDVIGRPHFAHAMVDLGHARTIKEAFDLYIGKGATGYVERYRIDVEDAIRLIHGAGGVAVLCHPMTLKLEETKTGSGSLLAFAKKLAAIGLDAMEVWCSERDSGRERRYMDIADEAGLLVSGGSDYHGHAKSDTRVGGNLAIPIEVLEPLRERARSHRSGER